MKSSLGRAVLFQFVYLLAIFGCQRWIAESWWPAMFIQYLPPPLLLIPPLVFLGVSLWRKRARLAHSLLVAASLFFIGGLQPRLPQKRPGDLRVMSYNVRHGLNGIEGVMQVIREHNPDVVCMQETNPKVDAAIRIGLPEYRLARFESVMILSRLPVVGEKMARFPKGTDRPMGMLQIEGPQRFTAVSVHKDPSRVDRFLFGNPLGLAEHLRQLGTIQRRQAEATLAALPDGPLILCGDFNGPPFGHRYNLFRQRLQDAFAAKGAGFGYTLPAVFPVMRIDWILVSPHWEVRSAYVPSSQASDHRPLVADLAVRP